MNTTRIAIFIDGAYLDATTRSECGGVKLESIISRLSIINS